MSLSPDPVLRSTVLRGAVAVRPATMTSSLADSPYAQVGFADPRLVDNRLIALVEEESNRARVRGFKAGFAEGREAGRVEGLAEIAAGAAIAAERDQALRDDERARIAAIGTEIQRIFADVLARQQPTVEELRDVVATMTVELAETLVGHHLEYGECGPRDAVTRALAEVPRASTVVLRLNPADVPAITELVEGLTDWTFARIVADPAVEPAGCVAQTESLEIDAQMSVALQRVRRVLQR